MSTWDLARTLCRDDQSYQQVKQKEAVVFRLVVGRQRLARRSPGLVDRGYVFRSSEREYRGKTVALYSLSLKGIAAVVRSSREAPGDESIESWVRPHARSHLVFHLLEQLSGKGEDSLVERFHDSMVDYFSRGLVNLELADDQLVCESMLYVLRRVLIDAEEKNGPAYVSEARKLLGDLLERQQSTQYWYDIDNATMVETVSLFCSRERGHDDAAKSEP